MNRFVWTERGKNVHVTHEYDESSTRCGRPAFGGVDASDVLWYHVCQKCTAALDIDRDRQESKGDDNNTPNRTTEGFILNTGPAPARFCGLRHCTEVATHHLTAIERLNLCDRHYQALLPETGGAMTMGAHKPFTRHR